MCVSNIYGDFMMYGLLFETRPLPEGIVLKLKPFLSVLSRFPSNHATPAAYLERIYYQNY